MTLQRWETNTEMRLGRGDGFEPGNARARVLCFIVVVAGLWLWLVCTHMHARKYTQTHTQTHKHIRLKAVVHTRPSDAVLDVSYVLVVAVFPVQVDTTMGYILVKSIRSG